MRRRTSCFQVQSRPPIFSSYAASKRIFVNFAEFRKEDHQASPLLSLRCSPLDPQPSGLFAISPILRRSKMKRVLIAIAAFCVLNSPVAFADPGHARGHDRWDGQDLPPGQAKKMWRKGDRIPNAYIVPQYFILEPRVYHLAPPRPGYRWIVVDGDAYLVEMASGGIADMIAGAAAGLNGPGDDRYGPPRVVAVDREDRWRQRYARTYTQGDDSFYRECHPPLIPQA